MSMKKRRTFTAEQRADAVRLARKLGNQSEAARQLGISSSMVHRWVEQAEIDEGRGPEGALTTEEKEELRRLRREVRTLREERDFLKKATAFFAKEQNRPLS